MRLLMHNYYYNQLGGALGLLKSNDVADIDFVALNEIQRKVARELGPYNCDSPEIIALHRTYRDECLARGLILCGQLFDDRDMH